MDFDKKKYKILALPHPLLLHWVINPGLAFNELVLGQRIPRITLIDKTSNAPLMERQYVPCVHCNTIHDSSVWTKQGAFKNWFGYFCPLCEKNIPCLWNLTSLVILALTFPVWGWFRRPLESKWRAYKKQLYIHNKAVPPKTAKNTSWLNMGLIYGGLMFAVMSLTRLVNGNVTVTFLISLAVVCLLAGVTFGGLMKFILGRRIQR